MTNACCANKAKNAVLITNVGRNTIATTQREPPHEFVPVRGCRKEAHFQAYFNERKKSRLLKYRLYLSAQENEYQNETARAEMSAMRAVLQPCF